MEPGNQSHAVPRRAADRPGRHPDRPRRTTPERRATRRRGLLLWPGVDARPGPRRIFVALAALRTLRPATDRRRPPVHGRTAPRRVSLDVPADRSALDVIRDFRPS